MYINVLERLWSLYFSLMKLVLKKKHPRGFWTIFRNLDLNLIFKKRDKDWFNLDRDFCVYTWKDIKGCVQYVGMGRYWDIENKWYFSRPFSHTKDMLCKTIDPSWICEILCFGLTSKEAHIIEAYLLQLSNRTFSKFRTYAWDGQSLINKKRERKYERMIEEYLNLDGNNYWETLRREINDN